MSNFVLDYWWLPNQHLKPGTQIFGHLIGEFDSFIFIWQIKNKNKIRPTYPFFQTKTMGNKIFLMVPNQRMYKHEEYPPPGVGSTPPPRHRSNPWSLCRAPHRPPHRATVTHLYYLSCFLVLLFQSPTRSACWIILVGNPRGGFQPDRWLPDYTNSPPPSGLFTLTGALPKCQYHRNWASTGIPGLPTCMIQMAGLPGIPDRPLNPCIHKNTHLNISGLSLYRCSNVSRLSPYRCSKRIRVFTVSLFYCITR